MKQIINDSNDKPYLSVEIDEKMLKLVLLQYEKDWTVTMDKRAIPELIKILQKAVI